MAEAVSAAGMRCACPKVAIFMMFFFIPVLVQREFPVQEGEDKSKVLQSRASPVSTEIDISYPPGS